jgi:hypothetical protein
VLEDEDLWTISSDQTMECLTDTGDAVPGWQVPQRQDTRVDELRSPENGVAKLAGPGIDREDGGSS